MVKKFKKPAKKKLHGVLFDLDGTLIDTAQDFVYCLNQLLDAHRLPLTSAQAIRPVVSKGAMAMVLHAFGSPVPPLPIDRLTTDFLHEYARVIGQYSRLFSGMAHCLNQLDYLGIPWGVVTNKNTSFTHCLLDKCSLLHRCQTIVCADTTSHSKPHPLPLRHALNEMNVSHTHCVYVGDAHSDVIACQRVPMACIVALYGYIEHRAIAQKWPASGYVDRCEEILPCLSQLYLLPHKGKSEQ